MAKNNAAAKQKIEKPAILKVVILDFSVLLFAFVILQWVYPDLAKAVLLGGLVFFIPNTVFSWISYRHIGANKIHTIVRNFFRAEALKYSLTLILFCYVFWQVPTVSGMGIFSAYIVFWGIHQWGVFGLMGRYRSHTPCCDR